MPFTGFDLLNASFAQRLQALIADAPGSLTIISGHRTTAEQQRLFDKLGPGLAARPGRSNHERGLAADLRYGSDAVKAWVHANAARFGLNFPMSHEPWHIEPLGLRDGSFDPGAFTQPPGPEGQEVTEQPAVQRGISRLLGQNAGGTGDFFNNIFKVFGKQQPAGQGEDKTGLSAFASVLGQRAQGKTPATSGFAGAFGGGKMSAEDVAKLAFAAGFRGKALITAVAVAMGESSLNPGAQGDTSLANAKWGPSVGLWQVRSLNNERGTGGTRDASRLADPSFNAQSAFSISSGGSNFSPWTVFKTGAYRRFLGEAEAAVKRLGVL